jgi:predicted metal-dependent phosphoesterase TrpH
MMKIDLHVHTEERSSCGKSPEDEQIQAAIAGGLDALAFTDHDRLTPRDRLRELNDQYAPFRVFNGIEVSIFNRQTTMFEHILVLGVYDHKLETRDWTYPDLHRFVRERDGFMAVAHPFRYGPTIGFDLQHFPPDAFEVYSHNTPPRQEPRIRQLADHYDARLLSNSDAHHADAFGQYYNLLAQTPSDERELLTLLKTGQYRCIAPA